MQKLDTYKIQLLPKVISIIFVLLYVKIIVKMLPFTPLGWNIIKLHRHLEPI